MIKVESSFIDGYEYDADNQQLHLYIRGKLYTFEGVPQSEIDLLTEAIKANESVGHWYNTRIRGKFSV